MKNRKSCFFAIAASGGFILFVIWWIFLGPIVFPKIKLPVAHGQRYAEGNFPLCVRKPGNHNILVRYIIPLDPASGRPLKSASQIVFYAPYNGDSKRIARRLPSWLKFFPEIAGFSVFSFTIDVDNDMIFQKNKYYIYEEAGWYELVFMIKDNLERNFGLQNKKLMIVGESSGGSWAQRLAATHPDKISAAAWCGGGNYARFSTNASSVRLLALNVDGCVGLMETKQLVKSNFNRINIYYGILPAWEKTSGKIEHHAAGEIGYRLIQSFISNDPHFELLLKQMTIDFFVSPCKHNTTNPAALDEHD